MITTPYHLQLYTTPEESERFIDNFAADYYSHPPFERHDQKIETPTHQITNDFNLDEERFAA
ncbi:MAG: hypothetical protein WC796_00110 [Candidatus Pacearchaeota archaeon]|jgi:hypothetical protein